jgi:enoyl-[acyl-carrier protein] reductase I
METAKARALNVWTILDGLTTKSTQRSVVRGHMSLKLLGRNAVVFGVANKWSIGWSIAQAWQSAGANVAVVCATERIAGSVSNLVGKHIAGDDRHGRMDVLCCDVTCETQVQETMLCLDDMFNGKLHALLHSVAFTPSGVLKQDYSEVSFEDFCATQNTTAYSFNRICRHAKRLLIEGGKFERGGASVVTLSFIGSSFVVPNYHVVGVAKSCLESSTRYLAAEFGPYNIRVNALSPGPINTAAARGIPNFRKLEKSIMGKTLLQRNALPDEIATAATFLASSDSSCITGQTIYADCGFSSSKY